MLQLHLQNSHITDVVADVVFCIEYAANSLYAFHILIAFFDIRINNRCDVKLKQVQRVPAGTDFKVLVLMN